MCIRDRFYAVYHDITKEREEQEHIRRQYNDLIIQHYRTPNPNTLLVGYCNITQNRIMDLTDYTDQGTLKNLGMDREQFLIAFSSFILDEEERRKFLNTYRREPTLAAFKRSEKKRAMKCFIHLPGERRGRYVEIETNMVFTPENRDVAGVLSLTDITDKIVADRIMNRLSVTGYDFVADLDLIKDRYQILSRNQALSHIPPNEGSLSQWRAHMLESIVIPRDIDQYKKGLDPDVILERLKKEDAYTFTFSVADDNGDIRTKNMIVSAIDLRIGRVCLSRIDITDSIREQQGFLNMLAYTFELAGLIDIANGRFLMYTRNTVLKNLPPYIIQNYNRSVLKFCDYYDTGDNRDCVIDQFRLTSLIKGLSERPSGYDFVLPYTSDSDLKYKQINVLWGDENHKTICLVRADVTDILTAERKSKAALENALLTAKEASKAKSDFLSSMSHDIRTPMNAIMGMTTLAVAHIDDQEWVTDCLQKISASSKHLLSLINDVLDMSKIESSKITLNHMKISLEELMGQLSDIMASQAGIAGVELTVKAEEVKHQYFYGDALRINQILINILSNAVKFTPEGGWVHFTVTELSPLNGEKWVRYRFIISDNGAGISKEALPCIFDSFTRSSRTSSVEGTGLGLSITKGLVDLMGGRITVESQPGQGSTFYVELEFEISESQASETKFESQCSDPTKEKIFAGRCFLVCEDTPINAEILREMLKMQGAQCVIRTDGLQAVKTFTKAPPGTYDAILMDIQMPVMNGYEAARTIRKMGREDAATIPIIAMTANAFAEDIQLSLEAGMDAHVAKPIDMRVLKNTLCTILNIT